MKILFIMLAVQVQSDMYLRAAGLLINEIVSKTSHDVLITTNNTEFYSGIVSSRVTVRNIIPPDLTLCYPSEYNYNSKYIAFRDLPSGYDVIFYVDCDAQLTHWNQESDNYIERLIASHEFGATRLNAYLGAYIDEHLSTGICLFSHKITAYNLENLPKDSDLRQARLPSEHFLIFKNIPTKITNFCLAWEEQNRKLQLQSGTSGSWGDGFEIGVAVHKAGFDNINDISPGDSVTILGVLINGNKL